MSGTGNGWMMAAAMLLVGAVPSGVHAQEVKSVDAIAVETSRRIFRPMERFEGKMMMLPDVMASLGVLRYAEAMGDNASIEKIKKLYLSAYRDGKNSLSYGHIEDQVTAVLPMELYRLTGDAEVLVGVRAVYEGQRLNATTDGLYRHLRMMPGDVFTIGAVQTLGGVIFADAKGMDFGATNLAALGNASETLAKAINTPKTAETLSLKSGGWESEYGLTALGLAETLRNLPEKHAQREKLVKAFVEVMAVEHRPALSPLKPWAESRQPTEIGSGIGATGVFDLGIWTYAACVGMDKGWLDKKTYEPVVRAAWKEIAGYYKMDDPSKDKKYDIIYRPYLEWSGVLLAATGINGLDKGFKYKQAAAAPDISAKAFADGNGAVSRWAALRSAAISGDAKIIDAIDKEYRASDYGKRQLQTRQHTDAGMVLIAMELYRLTGKLDVQMGVIPVLDAILDDKVQADAKLLSMVMEQAFRTYGRESFLKKAGAIAAGLDDDKLDVNNPGAGGDPKTDGLDMFGRAIKARLDKIEAEQKRIDARPFAAIDKALLADGKEKELALALARRDAAELGGKPPADLNKDECVQLIMALDLLGRNGDADAVIKRFSVEQKQITASGMLIDGLAFGRAMSALKDAKLADEWYRQMKAYCDKLQSPDGLYRPAEGASACARSTGQAALGLCSLLRTLPKEHPGYVYLKWSYTQLAHALQRTQDAQGMWHVVPDDWNSPADSGATAMLAYTLAVGLEQVWIEETEYRDMLKLAITGLKGKLDDKARLTGCAAPLGTPAAGDASHLGPVIMVKGESLGMAGLSQALAAADAYWHSPQSGAEVDYKRAFGPLFDLTCRAYSEKLADNKYIEHASFYGVANLWPGYQGLQMKLKTEETEEEFMHARNRMGWWEDRDVYTVPDSLKKQPFPCGGISVWLKDNPSVNTVTNGEGNWILSMAYTVLKTPSRSQKGLVVCYQAPGQKPYERAMDFPRKSPPKEMQSGGLLYLRALCTGPCDPVTAGLPEGPADKVNGYLLAETLLNARRTERAALQKLLANPSKPLELSGNRTLQPVYLRGKVVSSDGGKPVYEASIWLKRNPFIMYRAMIDGEFEIMFSDAVLYEQCNDALMITAPGHQPLEVPLTSYMNDKLVIAMHSSSPRPEVIPNATTPMVRIPGGFFRYGKGVFRTSEDLRNDCIHGNCWPIQTTYMPSFLYGQYQLRPDREEELVAWANQHGYQIQIRSFPLMFNAMSERDGLSPCYYTPDLRVIRKSEDLTDNMICNWHADGYRVATYAEHFYACYAGRTSIRYYGVDDGKSQLDIMLPRQSIMREFGGLGSYFGAGGRPACRRALEWGIYDSTNGHGWGDSFWDYSFWLTDDRYHPRGPSMKQTFACNQLAYGGRGSIFRFDNYDVDYMDECQFYDEWPANPTGFFTHDWGMKAAYITVDVCSLDSFREKARMARTVENICNDISLLKKVNDPAANLPGPLTKEKVTDKTDMVQIKGGKVNIGSGHPRGTYQNGPGAPTYRVPPSPQHAVQLDDFSIARCETTVAQWRAVRKWAAANGYTDLPEGSLGTSSSDDPTHPVVGVTWHDVVKWCNAASEMEKKTPCYTVDGKTHKTGKADNVVCDWKADGYRLPTESEWEHAARGGNETNFFWGEYITDRYAWVTHNRYPAYSAGKVMHPVGRKVGNQYGLYDAIGNAAEWCWDWAGPYDMVKPDAANPRGPENLDIVRKHLADTGRVSKPDAKGKDGGQWQKPTEGRCIRGGSYMETILQGVYTGFHGCWERGVDFPDKANDITGFRVAAGRAGK